MKTTTTLLLSFLIISQVFGIDGRKSVPKYVILSDEKDSSVANGYCTIEGQVLHNGTPISDENINCFMNSVFTSTDSNGAFKITFDSTENGIYTTHGNFTPTYLEDYQFKSGHKIVMIFNIKKPNEYEISYPNAVKKPVIYAYGNTGTSFDLKIRTKAEITFTYPLLEEKWEMTIAENGMLTDKNNLQYPYLFWEGEMKSLSFQTSNKKIEGTIVTKKNIVGFLEEKLDQLGFNSTEKTDFITFWAPLIKKYEESFIQFLVDKEYDVISKMEIIPQPDNIRRVYLLFSDASQIDDNYINTSINFDEFDRNGFTILEWGGSELTNIKKL